MSSRWSLAVGVLRQRPTRMPGKIPFFDWSDATSTSIGIFGETKLFGAGLPVPRMAKVLIVNAVNNQ